MEKPALDGHRLWRLNARTSAADHGMRASAVAGSSNARASRAGRKSINSIEHQQGPGITQALADYWFSLDNLL